jgi:hypothetical protein
MAVRRLFKNRRSLAEILASIAAYQLASATTAAASMSEATGGRQPVTNPALFAGVSSAGFPISEPLVATIDRYVPAPPLALPEAWWDDVDSFMAAVEQLVESEIQDAGRSAAQVELNAAPDWQNYVRVLVPPSCKRCVVLAGRIYRDLEGFERHPKCDCVHWPAQDWEQAHDEGLVSSPREAFDKGAIRDLTEAEAQAIRDGADITAVVNSSRGIRTADLFGRRVKVTTSGTTKRAAWRKANPTLLVRLRPESIYRIADGDHAEVLRLLRLYGYLTS